MWSRDDLCSAKMIRCDVFPVKNKLVNILQGDSSFFSYEHAAIVPLTNKSCWWKREWERRRNHKTLFSHRIIDPTMHIECENVWAFENFNILRSFPQWHLASGPAAQHQIAELRVSSASKYTMATRVDFVYSPSHNRRTSVISFA